MAFKKILTLSSIAAAILGGCATTNPAPQNKSNHTMYFEPVNAPISEEGRRSILASQSVTIDGKGYPIAFHPIIRTGEKLPSLDGKLTEIFGALKDEEGNVIVAEDGGAFICKTSIGGSGPDHTTLHEKEGNLFAITQFECAPGAMYITKLDKEPNGALKAVATSHISQAADFGGFIHCAGMKTPWGSHLGSEEYEPDAALIDANNKIDDEDGYYNNTALFFKNGIKDSNPYFYGWTPEVKILDKEGNTEYKKHFSMGRFAHELAYVMPDEKTVYLSDDGTNGGFYMFIAKEAGNLSEGTLYAAKLTQKDENNGGVFSISWINLGNAKDSDIKNIVSKKVRFEDIFTSAKPKEGSCPSGFGSINTSWGHECLRVNTGMAMVASRLETRRFAALKGATTEFRKEEGITFNPKKGELYMAMSRIQYGMEDAMKSGKANNKYDVGGANDIRIPHNPCGGVYKLTLGRAMQDDKGAAIPSEYAVDAMAGEIMGTPRSYPKGSDFEANKCDINTIAEPDNLTFIENSDILIIGEDTGLHQNDFIWAYDVEKKALTRILSTPYGSESTSPFWYPNIGGSGYLTTVVQHPFGESDKEKQQSPQDLESWIGVVGPFPVFSK